MGSAAPLPRRCSLETTRTGTTACRERHGAHQRTQHTSMHLKALDTWTSNHHSGGTRSLEISPVAVLKGENPTLLPICKKSVPIESSCSCESSGPSPDEEGWLEPRRWRKPRWGKMGIRRDKRICAPFSTQTHARAREQRHKALRLTKQPQACSKQGPRWLPWWQRQKYDGRETFASKSKGKKGKQLGGLPRSS